VGLKKKTKQKNFNLLTLMWPQRKEGGRENNRGGGSKAPVTGCKLPRLTEGARKAVRSWNTLNWAQTGRSKGVLGWHVKMGPTGKGWKWGLLGGGTKWEERDYKKS